ncbi:MAG: 2-isopropylmalate synthase [Planctomycetaceae bacterium]|jgi:2-isopropylmalate synthase|nr:2-isopropylmalate synthase [Planctomycetaceae bacterium]
MSSDELRQVTIFDTTLRDGEQSPGASMNLAEKLEVAQALVELGVDVIEAGFPISSPGDFEAVQKVAEVVRGVEVCGLARSRKEDIIAAWEALKHAEQPRIHIFLATSPIHREHKLRKSPDQLLEMAVETVAFAKTLTPKVEFSPEDASRTEIDFLCKIVEAVIHAGATSINIPDTVGYTTPPEMYERVKSLVMRVPNIAKTVLSVHCHNDLGMATANSLAAVMAGAGQIECTINGLGERAGNCALEEVVMAMKTRSDCFQTRTNIITSRLVPVSHLVSTITGLRVPRNKAIVGQNAFAHESGVHQDGMLKNPSTYEIMTPEDVGFQKSDLVLGKHSGRAALIDRVRSLGHELTPEQVDVVFAEFKRLADRKKEVYDADLVAIIEQRVQQKTTMTWEFVSYELTCKTGQTPKLTLTLKRGGETFRQSISAADGPFDAPFDGPVDAMFLAVCKLTNIKMQCLEYTIRSVTDGSDAQGEVSVYVDNSGRNERGQGVSTDIFEASAIAFVNAVNRILT